MVGNDHSSTATSKREKLTEREWKAESSCESQWWYSQHQQPSSRDQYFQQWGVCTRLIRVACLELGASKPSEWDVEGEQELHTCTFCFKRAQGLQDEQNHHYSSLTNRSLAKTRDCFFFLFTCSLFSVTGSHFPFQQFKKWVEIESSR